MKCFYHSADLDGKCSAAIIRMAYPNCALFGIDYGDEFPWGSIDPEEVVYMVDFSLQPFTEMCKLSGMVPNFHWIDHHKSALDEDAKPKDFHIHGLRKVGKAGCELVWEYLYPDTDLPLAVTLLGRYDVWDHKADVRVLAFQYGMRGKDGSPNNDDLWRDLLAPGVETVNHIANEGNAIIRYEKTQNENYMKKFAFEVEFAGLKFIAANKHGSSQMFESVYDPKEHDGMMAFQMMKGGRWTVSIFTDKPGVDLGTIAKKNGGGGHAGAAGFQCDEIPF